MRNKDHILSNLNNSARNFIKFRGFLYHLIINTSKIGNESGYITFGINQAGKRIGNLKTVMNKYGDFGNLAICSRLPGGLNVDNCVQILKFKAKIQIMDTQKVDYS